MEKKIVGFGLVAGLLSGLASFGFARTWGAPVIADAIEYEEQRSSAEAALTGEHVHEHEVFTRALQENVGAGVGTIVFAIAMGALFAVSFIVVSNQLYRRHLSCDPRSLAMMLAGAGFVSVNLVPFLAYPANPPGVGLAGTLSARTSAYLLAVGLAVGLAVVASAVALRLAPKVGGWTAIALGSVGYLVAVGVTTVVLPSYDETPGALTDARGTTVFPGFPADVLADFRMYSIGAQAILWLVLGGSFAVLISRTSTSASAAHPANLVGAMHAGR
jgi:hypothetical protein